jgi:hypothetical protein
MSKLQGTVQAISGGGGGVTDGTKGDITVSGGGTVWTMSPEVIDDRVAALLVAGANITLTYNDAGNILTIAASGGGGGSAAFTAATLTGVPYGSQYAEVTVTDAAISPASKIMIAWGMVTDADENTPDMDAVTFTAVPGSGSMVVDISCDDPLSRLGGTYKILYLLG